jgi:hypothetical protein
MYDTILDGTEFPFSAEKLYQARQGNYLRADILSNKLTGNNFSFNYYQYEGVQLHIKARRQINLWNVRSKTLERRPRNKDVWKAYTSQAQARWKLAYSRKNWMKILWTNQENGS